MGFAASLLLAFAAGDLFIGTEGLGHVSPAAAAPFGESLAGATCYLTDHDRIYTGCDPEVNADGSVDLTLKPNAFAYLETVLK